MTSVDIKTELRGHTAYTSIEMTYINPETESPLECMYSFPVNEKHLMAKLEIEIEGKVVSTKVTEKEQALEKYDDAVAAGNLAVFSKLQNKNKDQNLIVKLGNLQP